MMQDRYQMMNRPKEELVTIIMRLLKNLKEEERLEFISKWISPLDALVEANIGDKNIFSDKVELFCQECLDRKYFIDPTDIEYEDCYYDSYESLDFSETEWADEFSDLLKHSVMYSRSKNYACSFHAFDRLLECLHLAWADESILGTDTPMIFVDAEWNEVFDEYYVSMKDQISDKNQFASKAVDVWLNFGEQCTNSLLKNFDEITPIEESIRANIANHMESWSVQHELYELLKKFYFKLSLEFDEIIMAKSLVQYNPNFINNEVEGYIKSSMWAEGLQQITSGLKLITDEKIINALHQKKVECLEHSGMLNEAYDLATTMFMADNKHELYKRARQIAVKLNQLDDFVDRMLKSVESSQRYEFRPVLLRILSYEGDNLRLIDKTLNSKEQCRYDNLKYASKSLIFRALSDKNIILPDLREFLKSIEQHEIEGIADMLKNSRDIEDESFLLNNAVEMLKHMIQFHIDAAQRRRYSRAADYCALIKDIYDYQGINDEFDHYYKEILTVNGRRPALKDELNKRIR